MKYSPLAMIVMLWSLTAAVAQSLPNPGFESGLDEWKFDSESTTFSAQPGAARSGNLGLNLDGAPGGAPKLVSNRIVVVSGQKVTLSFWARASRGAVVAVMLVPYGFNNRPWEMESGKPPVLVKIKASSDWVYYASEYIVPGEVGSVDVWIRSWAKQKDTATLDDFDLKIE